MKLRGEATAGRRIFRRGAPDRPEEDVDGGPIADKDDHDGRLRATRPPLLISTGHWLGAFGWHVGVAVYLLPPALWALLSAALASHQTKYTYTQSLTGAVYLRRVARVVPEFERTPKSAIVTDDRAAYVQPAAPVCRQAESRTHRPYVMAELGFVTLQLAWSGWFAAHGMIISSLGALYLGACVLACASVRR